MRLRLYKVSERHIKFCKYCPFRGILLPLQKSSWMLLTVTSGRRLEGQGRHFWILGFFLKVPLESSIIDVQTEYNWVQSQEKCNHHFDVSYSDTSDLLARLKNTGNHSSLKNSNFPHPQSIYSTFPLKFQNFQADFWNMYAGDDMCLTMKRLSRDWEG